MGNVELSVMYLLNFPSVSTAFVCCSHTTSQNISEIVTSPISVDKESQILGVISCFAILFAVFAQLKSYIISQEFVPRVTAIIIDMFEALNEHQHFGKTLLSL